MLIIQLLLIYLSKYLITIPKIYTLNNLFIAFFLFPHTALFLKSLVLCFLIDMLLLLSIALNSVHIYKCFKGLIMAQVLFFLFYFNENTK